MSNKGVLVIGGNHHNTLGVIRSLGEKGIQSDVILLTPESKPYVSLSKYIKSCTVVRSDTQILDLLRDRKTDSKSVVIACSDQISSLLDCHYKELSINYNIPGISREGRVTYLMNKETMSLFAQEIGFNVPQSMAVDSVYHERVDIQLPWIIKPLISKDGQKTDIERVFSLEQWDDYCERHDSKVQIQQLVDKDYEYQLIGLSLNNGEEVVIPGVSEVIRPAATTNTGFLYYKPLDESYNDIVELGKRFVKQCGYSGLFSLEFLKGKDGKDYFMEINFRNDGNAICVTAAGINLPYIWYLYNAGEEYHNELDNSMVRPVYIMPEFTDFVYVLKRQLNFFKWIKDVHKTARFMDFDKQDLAPFICLLKQFIKQGVKKLIHLS